MPPKKRIREGNSSSIGRDDAVQSTTSGNEKVILSSGTEIQSASQPTIRIRPYKHIRDKVLQCVKTAFQAQGNIPEHTATSIRFLLSAMNHIRRTDDREALAAFFNELDIRLCMMWAVSTNQTARSFMASIIGFLFESGIALRRKKEDFLIFDIKYAGKIYMCLRKLMLDQPNVRLMAIRSLLLMQNETIPSDFHEAIAEPPAELLLRSFRDVSWECREAVVQGFIPTTAEHVKLLARYALSDKSLKVRIVALHSYGRRSIHMSDMETKLNVAFRCLTDHDKTIRDVVKKHVIEKWLLELADEYKKKKQQQEEPDIIEVTLTGERVVEEQPIPIRTHAGYIQAASCMMTHFGNVCDKEVYKKVHVIMMTALDSVRTLYNMKSESMESFGKAICEDIEPEDLLFHRDNYEKVLEDHGYDMEKLTNHVIFWRMIVEFFAQYSQNSIDSILAIDRMVPDILKMVILMYKKAWVDMLTDVYFTMGNPKEIVDTATQDLVAIKHGNGLISEISSGIAELITKSCFGGDVDMDTVFTEMPTRLKVSPQKMNDLHDIVNYELPLFHSALKADIVQQLDTLMKFKYNTLIKPHLNDANIDLRLYAIECVGIIGMIDFDYIKNELVGIARNFDEQPMDIKCSIVTILGDWCIHYRDVDFVSNRIREFNLEIIQQNSFIPEFLCNIIMSKKPEIEFSKIVLKSVEVLAKMLLNLSIDPDDVKWQKSFITLISVTIFKADDNFKSVFQCLVSAFLKCFAGKWENQMLVVKMFKQFFIEWNTNPVLIGKVDQNVDIHKRLKRTAELFAIITRHSLLAQSETILSLIEFGAIPKDELRLIIEGVNELIANADSSDSEDSIAPPIAKKSALNPHE
ncbi:unnamed protein product [Caenorhabditis bovis]|uniref:Nuclear condensin complex subunit 3 C-terminal domain-containing protein n=1 Tax=Caenorhabditis bovis TaxID=2654633 RepID=A0A8S1FFA2_9PELO|nr:unnamed protein product [Caenorhabditis bovis]